MNFLTVGIIKSTLKEVDVKLPELLNLINYKPKKKKVFIKPNVVDAITGKSGVIVAPQVIDALIKYYMDNHKIAAEDIVIGEGTGYFNEEEHFKRLVKESGYNKLEKKYGIIMENLQNTERITKKWNYGEIEIPKYLETHEYVNVPVMKTHMQATVTLSLKNQKGLLLLKDKQNFHRPKTFGSLHESIYEFSKVAVPDLVITSAIYALEGTGPTLNAQSKTKILNLLTAGTNMVEVDNVSCEIMGFDVNKIKHIPKTDYSTVGVPLEEVKTEFAKPEPFLKVQNVYVHQTDGVCTQCGMSISRMFRKILFVEDLRKEFDELNKVYDRIDIVLGSDFEELPKESKQGQVFCVGACASKLGIKNKVPYVKECPPNHNDIIKMIFSNTS